MRRKTKTYGDLVISKAWLKTNYRKELNSNIMDLRNLRWFSICDKRYDTKNTGFTIVYKQISAFQTATLSLGGNSPQRCSNSSFHVGLKGDGAITQLQ